MPSLRFQDVELSSHVLRESGDDSVLKIWLLRGIDGGNRNWERIITVSESCLSVGPLQVVPAAIVGLRERVSSGWLSGIVARWGQRNGASELFTPNGSKAAQSQPRRRDAILVLANDPTLLTPEVLRRHWPVAERFEQLGPQVWLVVGVVVSPDGKGFSPQSIAETAKTSDAIQQTKTAPARVTTRPATLSPPRAAADASLAPRDTHLPPSRVVRVFVSSTFLDMKAERNYLMASVFPMLRKLCESRGVTWGVVDFRWGITQVEVAERQVLPICLREVQRCDFFIGLLGERYGWIPSPDDLSQEGLAKHEWLKEYRECSLTEIEIVHGALREPPAAKHAFFYVRDPEYLTRLPADADPRHFHSESPATQEAVQRLKARIGQARDRGRCHLRADPFRTVEELGAWVLEDFRTLIDSLYPLREQAAANERDADVHLAQAQSRARVYVARQQDFDRLQAHVQSRDPPLVVLGDSGMGKSALLANYFLRRRQQHPDDFALIHFIGCTPDSADEVALQRRIMSELKRHFQWPDEVPFLPDQVRNGFRQWLLKAAGCGGVLLLLDGLNQLHDQGRALDLDWLPSDLSPNCRVILSTLPGRPLDALRRRKWPEMTVAPMDDPLERRQLLHEYLAEDARHLGEAEILLITQSDRTVNPLFLRSMLDELRRSADHDQLRFRIPQYLEAQNPQQLFVRLLKHWQEQFGADLVRHSLTLLWGARHGLAEVEIVDLLGGNQDPLVRQAWSHFYFATESIFVQRCGLLGFSHDYIRAAVQEAFLKAHDDRRRTHGQLAVYFAFRHREYLSDRVLDELAWHYYYNEDWSSLKQLLTERDVFVKLRETERGKSELQRYWLTLACHYDPCDAYAEAARVWEQRAKETSELTADLSTLATFHHRRAEYHAAEPLMRRALAIDERSHGADHPQVARDVSNLALLLKETNRMTEAEPLMRRALAIFDRSMGTAHPHVASCLTNLAALLRETNRLGEAEPLIRRALAIDEQCYGAEHPTVATDLNNLAQLLKAMNQLAAAEPLMRRALAIDEQSYGAEHPTVAIALNNLASFLQATNRLAEAEPLMHRALKIDEEFFGKEHPTVAMRLNNLALLLQATNRLAEAESLMRRALAIYEQSFGADHPNVATALSGLASLLQATSRPAEAEPLMRRALFIWEQSNHPHVAEGLSYLAMLLKATNRVADAEPLIRRALAIAEQSYGDQHPVVASKMNNLATLLQDTGRLVDAEPLMRRALDIFEQSYGASHPEVAIALSNLAGLLRDTDRLAEAELLLGRVVAIFENPGGEPLPNYAGALNNLAMLLQDRNRLADAEPLCRKLLGVFLGFKRRTGHEHPHWQVALAAR